MSLLRSTTSVRPNPYTYRATSRHPRAQVTHRDAQGMPPSRDSVSLSSAERPRDGKRMALLGAIGTAVGIAVGLLIPGAGVGAALFGGLLGGVGGAAIADGALTEAGTRPAKSFDPYKASDILDPDNMFHPRNPFSPWNFAK